MAAPKLGHSIGADEQGVCAAPQAHVLPVPCFMPCCARSVCAGLNSEVLQLWDGVEERLFEMMREPGSAARRRDGGGASARTVDQEATRWCLRMYFEEDNQKPPRTYSDEMDRASLVQECRSAASSLSLPQSKLVEAQTFLWALGPAAQAPAHQLFPGHPAAAGPARSFGQQRRQSVSAVEPLRINSEEGTRARRLWQRAIVAATSGAREPGVACAKRSSTKNAHRSW
jgi:hypothetical protein